MANLSPKKLNDIETLKILKLYKFIFWSSSQVFLQSLFSFLNIFYTLVFYAAMGGLTWIIYKLCKVSQQTYHSLFVLFCFEYFPPFPID